MSVQISTRIDDETKRRFDNVCESIGISPSNALSMFIRSVINYNGIPFNAVVNAEKIPKKPNANIRPPFEYGSMSGNVWMADDFDAPLDDFKEYME